MPKTKATEPAGEGRWCSAEYARGSARRPAANGGRCNVDQNWVPRWTWIARRLPVGPVTLVLDNARYQRNDVVKELAKELGIEWLFLPYSPNLNLIERLWRFAKRKAVYGKYHPTFADFRAASQAVLDGTTTTHADRLASLMTLKFQEFENVSLLAA